MDRVRADYPPAFLKRELYLLEVSGVECTSEMSRKERLALVKAVLEKRTDAGDFAQDFEVIYKEPLTRSRG